MAMISETSRHALLVNAEWNIGAVLASSALTAFVTYKVTSRSIDAASREGTKQREHDSRERQLDRDHERALAREQLVHQTRRDAYVIILKYLSYWERFASANSISVVLAPDSTNDPPPVISEDADAIANLSASDSVNAGVRDVQLHLRELHLELQTASDFEASIPAGISDAREQMVSARVRAREAARKAVTAIDSTRDQMRSELGTRSDQQS
jgi:hypothetical protein